MAIAFPNSNSFEGPMRRSFIKTWDDDLSTKSSPPNPYIQYPPVTCLLGKYAPQAHNAEGISALMGQAGAQERASGDVRMPPFLSRT